MLTSAPLPCTPPSPLLQVIIGCLPTYSVGPYTAGIAAPILLTIMRLLQGLAMGGEFGPAIIYSACSACPLVHALL